MNLVNPFWFSGGGGGPVIPTSGLLLHLAEGDPGSGSTWNDSGPNNTDGSLADGAFWSSGAVDVAGGLEYVGIVGGFTPLDGLTTATIVISFTMDALDGVLWSSSHTNGIHFIYVNGSGVIMFITAAGVSSAAATVSTATRYVAVCTKNGSNGEIFLNGVSVASGATQGALSMSGSAADPNNVYLGRYWNGPAYLNGKLHYLAHYDRVLTGPEIANLP